MDSRIPDTVESVRWVGDAFGRLVLVDQTRLPLEFVERTCEDVGEVWEAIRALRVRGAPAIGIAAAYGVCLGARPYAEAPCGEFLASLDSVRAYLASSRPTAVNLFWSLDRMRDAARRMPESLPAVDRLRGLLAEAEAIHAEDRTTCRAIGRNGATLIADGQGVLTHCNAGGLATAEYGTALAVLFTAQDQGKALRVFVDETRPLLQGARLTAWELGRRAIPTTLICDSMAAQVMREDKVGAVIVGADRIASNGDTANKIGTYGLAVLARAHGIPFYVAAPCSTFDMTLPTGDGIPIEERAAEEITEGFGRRTAPYGVDVYNPAFDVTPASLITAIVTERGVVQPVTAERIGQMLASPVDTR